LIAVGTKARARGLRDRARVVQLAPMHAVVRVVRSHPVVSGARSVVAKGAIARSAVIAPPSVVGRSEAIAPSVLEIGIGGVRSAVLMAPVAVVANGPVLSGLVQIVSVVIVPARSAPVAIAPVLTVHPVIVRVAGAPASKGLAAAAAARSVALAAPRARAVSPRRVRRFRSAASSESPCAVIATRLLPAVR
jgi:hypothetical protein